MSSSNPTWRRVNHKVQCLVGMKTCRLSHQPFKGQLSTISGHLGQYYNKNKPIQVAGWRTLPVSKGYSLLVLVSVWEFIQIHLEPNDHSYTLYQILWNQNLHIQICNVNQCSSRPSWQHWPLSKQGAMLSRMKWEAVGSCELCCSHLACSSPSVYQPLHQRRMFSITFFPFLKAVECKYITIMQQS